MSEIVVHGIPGSPFLRSVEMGLREKGAPYRLQVLAPGESKGEAYLGLHPFGRIPVIEHDGFVLYTELTGTQVKELSDSVNALSEPLSQLTAAAVS